MAGYIGTTPVPQATQNREAFTATSGQTSFATAGYTPAFIDVYLNGVKLAAADYTATNGSDVVLASGAASGDILEVVAFSAFTVADQAFTGTTTAANLTVTGAFTSQGIDDNANAVAITIDSSENVGIGTSSPSANLEITQSGNNVGLLVAGGGYNYTAKFESSDAEANIIIEDSNSTNNGNMIGVATDDMYFLTGGSERMRISSSGVDINNSGQSQTLLSVGGGSTNAALRLRGSTGSAYAWQISSNAYVASALEFTKSTAVGGTTFSTPLMILDNSGNLLVGRNTLSGTDNTQGAYIFNEGALVAQRSSNVSLYLNRYGTDGDIAVFRKQGATVGSIGTQNGSDFYIGSSPATIGLRFQTNEIVPVSATGANKDAAIDVGKSNIRFKDLYLSGGVYLGGVGSANKLEDYEEGSYQPTVYGATTAGSTALNGSWNTLHYTKIGRQVTIQGEIRLSGSASGAGRLRITLPFTNMYTEGSEAVGSIQFWNADFDNNAAWVSVNIPRGAAYLQFKETTDNATTETPMDITDLGANAELTIGITYFVT